MKTKRTVSLALALCLALAFVPVSIAASPTNDHLTSLFTFSESDNPEKGLTGLGFTFVGNFTDIDKSLFTDLTVKWNGIPLCVQIDYDQSSHLSLSGSMIFTLFFNLPLEAKGNYEFTIKYMGVERAIPAESEKGRDIPSPFTADDWAFSHINQAYYKGFLPKSLQNNYKNNITRGEFVILAMSWLRYKTGMTNEELLAQHAKPEHMDRNFSDATNTNILAAARLDITAGTTASVDGKPGVFGADMQFDREQAAIMLMKICRIVGTFEEDVSDFGFTDIGAAQWLPDAVNYVGNNNVMGGKGGNRFAPKDAFQRQESIIVFNKMG